MYNNLTSSISTMTEDAVDTMMNLSGSQVELKDASNEAKTANYYIGETDINSLKVYGKYMKLPDNLDALTKDENGDDAFIVYITGGSREVENDFGSTETITLQTGYYKLINYTGGGICQISNNSVISEYLGASYLVNDTVPEETPKVELKNASDEVKLANNYKLETSLDELVVGASDLYYPTSKATLSVNDIIYITGGTRTLNAGREYTVTMQTGYYKCTANSVNDSAGSGLYMINYATGNLVGVEYLGTSYLV